MELFLDVCEYGAEAMVKMCKILLGVVVILKVHEVYGKREVRPALLVNGEEKIRTYKLGRGNVWHNMGSITLLSLIFQIQVMGFSFYRLRRS